MTEQEQTSQPKLSRKQILDEMDIVVPTGMGYIGEYDPQTNTWVGAYQWPKPVPASAEIKEYAFGNGLVKLGRRSGWHIYTSEELFAQKKYVEGLHMQELELEEAEQKEVADQEMIAYYLQAVLEGTGPMVEDGSVKYMKVGGKDWKWEKINKPSSGVTSQSVDPDWFKPGI